MNKTDTMEICARCTSNASYFTKNEDLEIHFCYGCGFTATNKPIDEEILPELYKSIKYIDKEHNLTYFPSTINLPKFGMVFADGVSPLKWKWAAVCAVPITKEEKKKFPPEQTYKMDMSTIQHFDERDFLDALECIGYFDSQNS